MKVMLVLISLFLHTACDVLKYDQKNKTENLGPIFSNSEEFIVNYSSIDYYESQFINLKLLKNIGLVDLSLKNVKQNCQGTFEIDDTDKSKIIHWIQKVEFCRNQTQACPLNQEQNLSKYMSSTNYFYVSTAFNDIGASMNPDTDSNCGIQSCSESDFFSLQMIVNNLVQKNIESCADQSRKFEIDETKKYFILSLTGVTMGPAAEDYKAINQLITNAVNQKVIQSVKPMAQPFEGGFYDCIEVQDLNQRKDLLKELTEIKTSVQESYYSIKSVESCN